MKFGKFKNLFFGICGVVAASAMFSACTLEPYELPQEELYLRNFIKKYGLIDPNQDFNEAKEAEITVIVGNYPQDVTVFIKNLERFYRVAYYAKASGTVNIPVDIPQTIDEVYVMVGEKTYRADIGETIDATVPISKSRAYTEAEITGQPQDLAWILVAEDLGATDDFDFNDMIIRIEAVSMNEEAVEELKLSVDVSEWEIIEWDEHLHLEDVHTAPARNRAPAVDPTNNYTKIRVTALAAGGTIPLYLHFQSDANNDATDKLVTFDYGLIDINSGLATDNYEWHRWFNENNTKQMINTGLEPALRPGKSSTFVLEGGFSMKNYSRVFSSYFNNGTGNDNSTDVPLPPGTDFAADAYSTTGKPIQGFFITVGTKNRANSTTIAGSRPGNAPQMFLIPDLSNHTDGLWHWPKERVSILDCFDGFREWVGFGEGWWYNRMKVGADVMDRLPVE